MKNLLLLLFILISIDSNAQSYSIDSSYTDSTLNGAFKLIGIVKYDDDTKLEESCYLFSQNWPHVKYVNGKDGSFELRISRNNLIIGFHPGLHDPFYTDSLKFVKNEVKVVTVKLKKLSEEEVRLKRESQRVYPAKPVIYLYPEKKSELNVTVKPKGKFTFTYPEHNEGWNVIALPDGTIKDSINAYDYLFWESEMSWKPYKSFTTEGSYVAKENTIEFLEKSLTEMGLNASEKNDFITYWGPRLIQNEINYIHFMIDDRCNEIAELNVSPKPQTMFRVMMVYQVVPKTASNNSTTNFPQVFPKLKREGFTVIEWGGMELKTKLHLN